MQLTIYREKVQEKDGYKSHKGEDGKPYVGARAFMVADGLGGSAAIRHTKFNKGLFDKERLMDVLFENVYDDYSNEEFRKYVLESFADFYAMPEDKYFKDILSMKKGGYFGSRIVTAIVLHEILCSEALWKEGDSIWDRIHAAKTVDELKAIQKETGDHFAKLIAEKLKKVAGPDNANLYYESPVKGLALLGTTLCATLYNDCGDYVEGLYLEAGDSRPYVMEAQGMAQVIADQEGDDGAMSNCIKANEDATFGIHCEYRRFKKPCILFNASDGCFDSSAFQSQLAFEKLILDCILGNDTEGKDPELDWAGMDEETRIAQQLRCFFEIHGRHDDSSTIAMKSFGFETFEEVQEFAKKRLKEIEETYLSELPDLLVRDYAEEEHRLQEETNAKLASKKTGLWENKNVRAYCKNLVAQKGTMPEYDAECRKADGKIEAHRATIAAKESEALELIKSYYLPILEEEGVKDLKPYKKALAKCKAKKASAESVLAAIRDQADEYQKKLEETRETLAESLKTAQMTDVDSVWEKEVCDTLPAAKMQNVFRLQEDIKTLLEDLASGKGKQSKAIVSDLQSYFAINQAAAKSDNNKDVANGKKALKAGEKYEYQYGPVRLANHLVELTEIIEKVVFIKKDREQILQLAYEINNERGEIQKTRAQLEEKLEEAAKKYWDRNFATVMKNVYEKGEPEVPAEDKAEIGAILTDTEKSKETAAAREKQKEIFEKYEISYNRVMESPLQLSEQAETAAEEETAAEPEQNEQSEQTAEPVEQENAAEQTAEPVEQENAENAAEEPETEEAPEDKE